MMSTMIHISTTPIARVRILKILNDFNSNIHSLPNFFNGKLHVLVTFKDASKDGTDEEPDRYDLECLNNPYEFTMCFSFQFAGIQYCPGYDGSGDQTIDDTVIIQVF